MSEVVYDESGQACCPECGEPLALSLDGDHRICKLCEVAYP